MDAQDLILLRKQQSENRVVEHQLDRARAVEDSKTGESLAYDGRNPATGELQVRRGDQRISVRGVSNSELTRGSQLQILDTGNGTPNVNFAPSPPPDRTEPEQTSENITGTMAYLIDSVIQGDAPQSCRDLQDIWALFSIVQYVKAARVMVLFSFPVETGSPVPYTCPRYVVYGTNPLSCNPTPDINAPYDSFSACASANQVICSDSGSTLPPPGTPMDAFGYPEGFRITNFPAFNSEITSYIEGNNYTGESPKRYYAVTIPETASTASYRFIRGYGSTSPDVEDQPSLITTLDHRALGEIFFSENGRAPRCGDSLTVNAKVIKFTIGARQVILNLDTGQSFRTGGDFSDISVVNETRNFTYQPVQRRFLAWLEGTSSGACGDFDAAPPRTGNGTPDSDNDTPPNYPRCDPEHGEASTIERQFWVGGHITTPIKLASINAEEEFKYYGSLMPDGYYVTLKHGRELINGTEQWCKTETFKTTNMVDWRTAEYNESKDLEPPLPDGDAGALISVKNNRANLTDQGKFEIDPTQTVNGAGNILRALNQELLVRPEGSFIGSQIAAQLQYTNTAGSASTINADIYRIVDVIPSELDTNTGCVEVQGIELAYSPLFIFP